MRHAVLVVAGGLLMAQSADQPKQALSPKLYRELTGQSDPVAEALKEMSDRLARFGTEHASLFVELHDLNQRLTDIQQRVNQQQTRMDAMDPSKAAERLTMLEVFVAEQKQHAQEAREESARQWRAFWQVSQWFGGILTVIVANELRKWVSSRKFRMTIEKAVVKPGLPDPE